MKKTTLCIILILCPILFYAQTYNPKAAVEYADYWWDGRNTNNWIKAPENFYIEDGYPYLTYNDGGDCANFVSQCLKAGGWDLSEGTDGLGTGVDKRGCIPFVNDLIAHLKYKDVPFLEKTTIPQYYSATIKGDPVFIRDNSNSYRHSLFCTSYTDMVADRRVYSTHSSDQHNKQRSYWHTMPYSTYFHITDAIPWDCFNCRKDEGEEEIDCGGICPPCEHAPQHKSFETPTNNLPSQAYALEKITAGNAAVEVLSEQDVTFNTLGEIVLLPGFEAQEGSDFTAQIKNNIHEVTAFCGRYCNTEYYPNDLTRYQDKFSAHDLINVDKVYYEIYNVQSGSFIHSEVVYVTKDGVLPLWDLIEGEASYPPAVVYYVAKIIVYPCRGGTYSPAPVKFKVTIRNKSLNEDSGETENPVTSPPQNPENTISPNGNTTLSFTIIPNPNPGTFQLETNFPLTEIGNLKITNLMGTPVYETQNVASPTIQLQNPTTGTFFVVMILKDGTVLSRKMVVQ